MTIEKLGFIVNLIMVIGFILFDLGIGTVDWDIERATACKNWREI